MPSSIERFFQLALLGMACSSFLALCSSGFVDIADICAVSAVLLLHGLILARVVRVPIPARALTTGVIIALAVFAADLLLLSRYLVAATAHLMFFLLALKQLAGLTKRDSVYLALFSFVTLIAGAVLSINGGFFFFLAFYLVFALAALTSGEILRAKAKLGVTVRAGPSGFQARLAVLSVLLTGGILVITAGLFFLLPRTAEAALSRFITPHRFITGFSDRVTLGEVGRIAQDSTPVMHVNAPRPPLLAGLKWRGSALTHFDGRGWTSPVSTWQPVEIDQQQANFAPPRQGSRGRFIGYEVTLDAPGNILFFAGSPVVIRAADTGILYDNLGDFRLRHGVAAGFRYEVYSQVEEPPEAAGATYPAPYLSPDLRYDCLRLPPLDSRIPELARKLSSGASDDLSVARSIERGLRTRYAYSLETPAISPRDPLADFLFTRRRGYCEYFASAMAVMLRSLNIPSRLATGFQGGVFNTVSGLWVVRASSAHAWVEAWIPGHGWTTFDPTPSAASNETGGLFEEWNLYVDAAGAFWREWVVAYDPLHQGTLASQVLREARGFLGEGPAATWTRVSQAISANAATVRAGAMIALAALILCVTLWYAGPPLLEAFRMRLRFQRVRRGHASAGDAALLYQRMLRVVKRRGFQKPPWFTPAEFAASLPRTPFAATVTEFTAAYNELRFGRRDDAATRMSQLLADLERAH